MSLVPRERRDTLVFKVRVRCSGLVALSKLRLPQRDDGAVAFLERSASSGCSAVARVVRWWKGWKIQKKMESCLPHKIPEMKKYKKIHTRKNLDPFQGVGIEATS
jgi:hypothetical protein